MTTCVRRQHSVWTTCQCPPCYADRNRMAKVARVGLYKRVPSETAWAVVDQLRAQGWTSLAVASAANIPHSTMQNAYSVLDITGRRVRFGPVIAAKIVNHGQPTKGKVGATGSRRRLQGLAIQGWDLRSVSDGTGIGFTTLASIRSNYVVQTAPRFEKAIREFTEQTGLTIGPSRLARAKAIAAGWESLLAWDNVDDPNEQPAPEPQRTRGRQAVIGNQIEDLEWLAEHDGINLTTASARIGLSKSTLHNVLMRAGRSDLYWRLADREPNAELRRATARGMERAS